MKPDDQPAATSRSRAQRVTSSTQVILPRIALKYKTITPIRTGVKLLPPAATLLECDRVGNIHRRGVYLGVVPQRARSSGWRRVQLRVALTEE